MNYFDEPVINFKINQYQFITLKYSDFLQNLVEGKIEEFQF